jgi:membrane protein implicated in regulation of membrane protease activity
MKFQNLINFFTNTHSSLESTNASFWLVIAFFFLIMEMGSPGLFFFIAFFFGGLFAASISFLTPSTSIQTVCFLSGTGVASLVLRYWIVPLIGKDRHHERTNVYALKGKQGFVVKNISFEHPGLVRINGEIWAAKIARDQSAFAGDLIEVVDVRGAHVVVKKV